MAKWRALHESIGRSRGLRGMSHHDALLYTWGLASTDNWGLLRCDHVKALVFPYRSTAKGVDAAVERLVTNGKLCRQQHNGHEYVHWCYFEDWQDVRKRMGSPIFTFTCHNDGQIRTGGGSGKAAEATGGSAIQYSTVKDNNKTPAPPTPPAAQPPSDFINAVMAQWPLGGGAFYGRYLRLEEEYGADFMWDVWLTALDSGKPAPPANYLEAIARNAVAEGRRPGERKEERDAEPRDNRPTEIDGLRVIGWVAGLPILDAPAKAP